MRRPLRVFISSTVADLRPYREAAPDAALAATADFQPHMMECFEGRGDNPPLGVCLEKVAEADVVVAIVAHRYGWEPPDQPGTPEERKSITWLEREHAAGLGKEVLAFVVEPAHS